MKTCRGFSLVEVLVSLSIVSVSAVLLTDAYVLQKKYQGFMTRSDVGKRILHENIIEVRSRLFTDIPKVGKCVQRIYDLQGELLSHTLYDDSGSSCDSNGRDQITVSWTIGDSQKVDFDSDVDTLKLPKDENAFKVITIKLIVSNQGLIRNRIQELQVFRRPD